jgi:hypothetical protein
MKFLPALTQAVLSLTTACALALAPQDQGAKPVSAIPPGFHFEGSWNCVGVFGNGKPHRSSMTGAIVVGGKWLELMEQDIEHATGYIAKYLVGYDAEQKQIVEFDANNFSAATYSSPDGWKGDALTVTSPVSSDPKAPYAANRFVFSIVNSDTFTMDWQVSKSAQFNWLPADHLVCKRGAQS